MSSLIHPYFVYLRSFIDVTTALFRVNNQPAKNNDVYDWPRRDTNKIVMKKKEPVLNVRSRTGPVEKVMSYRDFHVGKWGDSNDVQIWTTTSESKMVIKLVRRRQNAWCCFMKNLYWVELAASGLKGQTGWRKFAPISLHEADGWVLGRHLGTSIFRINMVVFFLKLKYS